MEQALRFKTMYTRLGFSVADAAKFLQVSTRTVHEWISGRVRIPYAAYKLMRLQLHYELPGDAWSGWSLSAGRLYTPEGHELSPHDFTWWSLLCRKAAMFSSLYAVQVAARSEPGAVGLARDARQPTAPGGPRLRGVAGAVASAYAQPCVQNFALAPTARVRSTPDGNHGEDIYRGVVLGSSWGHSDTRMGPNFKVSQFSDSLTWGQSGVKVGPWHSISDSPPPSIQRPALTVNGSESASIPLSASLSMRTCGHLSALLNLSLPSQLSRKPHVNRTPRPSVSVSRPCTKFIDPSSRTPCPCCLQSPPRSIGASLPIGTGATPPSEPVAP